MEQKTIYITPAVKSITVNARCVICISPSVGSESYEDAEVVNLDE